MYKSKTQFGGIGLGLVIIVLISIFIVQSYFQERNFESIGKTTKPYSAEFSALVDNGYSTRMAAVSPGIYHSFFEVDGATSKAIVTFNRDNTFQTDLKVTRNGIFDEPVSFSLHGTFKQSGAVIEFDKLVGDTGLVSQQKKWLLKSVSEAEVLVIQPSNGVVLRLVKVVPVQISGV